MAAQFLSAQHIAIVLKTVRYTHDISWYIQQVYLVQQKCCKTLNLKWSFSAASHGVKPPLGHGEVIGAPEHPLKLENCGDGGDQNSLSDRKLDTCWCGSVWQWCISKKLCMSIGKVLWVNQFSEKANERFEVARRFEGTYLKNLSC